MDIFAAGLDWFGRHDISMAGGKGANLGELVRAGFPVPAGFVVTTPAYNLVVRDACLGAHIAAALHGVNDTPQDIAKTSQTIRDVFAKTAIPSGVAAAVRSWYEMLGAGPVAIRSSATAEDLPTAAFAGQQDTYLNVLGAEAVLDAVRRCWASLWSDRAMLYRAHRGVDPHNAALAVVVQRMVEADVSGVCFTADPISGDREMMMLAASPGLGERVVGGAIVPDHFLVDKRTLAIRERRLSRPASPLPVWPNKRDDFEGDDVARNSRPDPCLSDAAVTTLARMAIAVERHFDGAPQDVEWAWKDDEPYLLQTRPLTTLPTAAAHGTPRDDAEALNRRCLSSRRAEAGRRSSRARFIDGLLRELYPMRPYPMDVSAYTAALVTALAQHMFMPLGMRVRPVSQIFIEEDGIVLDVREPAQPAPAMLYRPWLTLWRNRCYDPARSHDDPILAEAISRTRELQTRDLAALPWTGLLRTLHEAIEIGPLVATLRARYFPQVLRDTVLLWVLLTVTGRRRHFHMLQSGVETKTLETNRALADLAACARANPEVRRIFGSTPVRALLVALEAHPGARGFLAAFRAFLAAYGHRAPVLMLASQPTWRDAPETLLGMLQGMIVVQGPRSAYAADSTSRGHASSLLPWEQVRHEVLAGSVLGKRPFQGLFLRVLAGARCFPKVREDTQFYLTLAMPVVYEATTEIGRRLVTSCILDAPEDVWHLKLHEVEAIEELQLVSTKAAGTLRALAIHRKAKRASLDDRTWMNSIRPTLQGAPEDAVLTGLPASPGIIDGPVCVVMDVSESHKVRPGDVLVAPVTTPAWTPLFQEVAAVVVDAGGPASHAAIVAREYGIPAVMGTIDGTQRLTDGQRVRVDGTRGLVFRSSESERPRAGKTI